MRTVTAKVQTAIESAGTRPGYLMLLGFTTPLRLSTRGSVIWDGQTWAATPFRLNGPSLSEGGGLSGAFVLQNMDNGIGATVLNEGVRGKTCQIWALYGDAPYAASDPVMIFDGVMDGVPQLDDYATITFRSDRSRTTFCPRIRLAPPLCNHVPPTGTVITGNGVALTLERGE